MAIQNLTLPEIRLIQLSIVDARETGTGLNTDTPLRIDAMRYAEAFNTTRQNAYIRLREAEETLFNRRFTFTDKDNKVTKSLGARSSLFGNRRRNRNMLYSFGSSSHNAP